MSFSNDNNQFVNLPDDIFYEICSYLDLESNLNLGSTCTRLRDFLDEERLLECIDCTQFDLTPQKLFSYKNVFTKSVRHLFICLNGHRIEENLGKKLSICNNLTVLALEGITIEKKKLRLKHFPKSLEELSLKNTNILNSKSYFRNAKECLPNLHTIILDGCEWIGSLSMLRIFSLPLTNMSFRLVTPRTYTFALLKKFQYSTLRRLDIVLPQSETRKVLAFLFKMPFLSELYVEAFVKKPIACHTIQFLRDYDDSSVFSNYLFNHRYLLCKGLEECVPYMVWKDYIFTQGSDRRVQCHGIKMSKSLEVLVVRNINLRNLAILDNNRHPAPLTVSQTTDRGTTEMRVYGGSLLNYENNVICSWRCTCVPR